jgi:hypothetical protein
MKNTKHDLLNSSSTEWNPVPLHNLRISHHWSAVPTPTTMRYIQHAKADNLAGNHFASVQTLISFFIQVIHNSIQLTFVFRLIGLMPPDKKSPCTSWSYSKPGRSTGAGRFR